MSERKKPVVIRFLAPINDATVNSLMNAIDTKMKEGISEFIILISSTGGSVYHGLSAYHYLKGIPAKITTHNFGVTDSMALVMYCAGEKRLSVPQARFLLHGPVANIQKTSLDEAKLLEILKTLRNDTKNIAEVIAENTNQDFEQIRKTMLRRTALIPEDAKSWNLVHEIKLELFEKGSEVISITNEPQKKP